MRTKEASVKKGNQLVIFKVQLLHVHLNSSKLATICKSGKTLLKRSFVFVEMTSEILIFSSKDQYLLIVLPIVAFIISFVVIIISVAIYVSKHKCRSR